MSGLSAWRNRDVAERDRRAAAGDDQAQDAQHEADERNSVELAEHARLVLDVPPGYRLCRACLGHGCDVCQASGIVALDERDYLSDLLDVAGDVRDVLTEVRGLLEEIRDRGQS